MQHQGKTREELLQEWKAERAAKAANTAAANPQQQQAGKGGAPLHKAAASAIPARKPVDKENSAEHGPATGRQPPAGLPARTWDSHGGGAGTRKPALLAGQKAQMEQQFGVLEGRLQALKRESLRPAAAAATVPAPAPIAPLTAAATQLQPAAELPEAGAAAVGGLAARLNALKRESVRPSFTGHAPGSGAGGVQFEAAGQLDMHTLSRLAGQLFNDEAFLALCDKGMNSQLTRSKDGATEETKIMELAGERR